jgi:hypothetical protein
VNQVHDEVLKLAMLSGPAQNGRFVFPEEGKSSTCTGLAETINNVPKYPSKMVASFSLLTQHKMGPSQHSTASVSVEVGAAGRQSP